MRLGSRPWAIEERAAAPAALRRRLSPGAAVLLIGGVSAALWFGIARLLAALF